MTKSAKTGLTIVIIIIVILIIWWIADMSSSPAMQTPAPAVTNTTYNSQPYATTTGAAVTSTSSVNSDLNSIDGQMNGLNQDNASADQSMQSSQ